MAADRRTLRGKVLDRYALGPNVPDWLTSDWINDQLDRGQREVSRVTECIQGTCSFSAAADTRTYSLTTDYVRIESVEADSNRGLNRETRERIRADHGDWRGATGVLCDWYREDKRLVGFYPMPATAGSSLYVYGPRYATPFTSETASTEIATGLEDGVVDYVCREMAKLDPGAGADRKLALFNASYNNTLGLDARESNEGGGFYAPRG